jgi:hypothetical protein
MPTKRCEWTNQKQAFAAFAGFTEKTQSAGHIKPLHWYVACRLVLEGGFHPDAIKPRPPFIVENRRRKGLHVLRYEPDAAGGGEATLLGGLKTKNVDVVVDRPGIGPVLAVSCKGTTGAFRNLTNRMEELIGDCTNLHISYPALVLGYLHVLRANRRIGEIFDVIQSGGAEAGDEADFAEEGASVSPDDASLQKEGERRPLAENDMAFGHDHEISPEIRRFGIAVERLAGRSGLRDDLTRYESIGIALIEAEEACLGDLVEDYPSSTSSLDVQDFFERLYVQYDERFVYGAPKLAAVTRRLVWSPESPAFESVRPDYVCRAG